MDEACLNIGTVRYRKAVTPDTTYSHQKKVRGNTCKVSAHLLLLQKSCYLAGQSFTPPGQVWHARKSGGMCTNVAVLIEIDSISRYLKYSRTSMYTIDTMICSVVTAHRNVTDSAAHLNCALSTQHAGSGLREGSLTKARIVELINGEDRLVE